MPGTPGRPPGWRGADIGDRREQGVLAEVVGLPLGDLIEQVRFGPAAEGCGGQRRVLELAVLLAAERCPCRKPHPYSSCRMLILMKHPTESVASSYVKARDLVRATSGTGSGWSGRAFAMP